MFDFIIRAGTFIQKFQFCHIYLINKEIFLEKNKLHGSDGNLGSGANSANRDEEWTDRHVPAYLKHWWSSTRILSIDFPNVYNFDISMLYSNQQVKYGFFYFT